jgi:heat shock protein 5
MIQNDNNRLSKEDIERMINDAEKFSEEDKAVKEKVEAKNDLEGLTYNLKNQIDDKEKLGGKLSDEEKSTIENAVDEKNKMVACSVCNTHIPENEAIIQNGRIYCSKEHLE